MSSPAEYFKSLPPISKAYGTACLLTTIACQIGLLQLEHIALLHELVIFRFQVWRLITNFFFLGKFSINFGIRLLMIARYGVQLENGPFQRRTADFLWMMIFGALSLLVCKSLSLCAMGRAFHFLRFPFSLSILKRIKGKCTIYHFKLAEIGTL
ncbi:derlin-1-like, partial [Olea europaea var. sylvestris]|uniref:derlin-1-like n=1 Tax=Olea europaea var. sylvestris TaxID=158386 RepID=UPI000C1D6078